MSDLGYLIWILATAAMTVTVLTVGTLAAAGMLPASQGRRHTGREAHGHDRSAEA